MEVCEMQKANVILSMVNQKSRRNKDFEFSRIYRNLYNTDFYLNAYAKMYSKEGNMTQGVDGKTIDGFNMGKVEKLITLLKNERYYPKPTRRVYIPKKNSKMRPLGIPCFEDKLVQEVMRQILEAIYEPLFSENSHGFRPGKSPHTALKHIQKVCKSAAWMIEGDITKCFENIDHEILLKILSKKIDDGRFIELIRRFLKAGYFELNQTNHTFSGTPQGSIISPILANIYMNEFDSFMVDLIAKYEKGQRRKPNPEYRKLESKRLNARRHGNFELAKQLLKEMRTIPSVDTMDKNFIRVGYVRYADDFIISVIGNKKLAETIKTEVSEFLLNTLKLNLNEEKTLITNLGTGKARFLGYEIARAKDNTKVTKNTNGSASRSINGLIQLLVPRDVIQKKITDFSEKGRSCAHKARVNLPVLDMINQYNAEIRGLYYYYRLAANVSKRMYAFKFVHYTSLLKTIARKEKKSVNAVIKKYGIDVPRKSGTGAKRVVGVSYKTKKGIKIMTYFDESMKRDDTPVINLVDHATYYPQNCQLITRLNASVCEMCGSTENIEVHHVRRLKDIHDKYKRIGKPLPSWVLTMVKMKRKTLILCSKCHDKVHAGK